MEALNIMVVDDSILAVKMMTDFITELGHKVVKTAGSGREALTAYEVCKPDVVTMDITMPDIDGIQATQTIMSRHPDARVIMVTSHAQERSVMSALHAGARSYVLKPIQKEKLREVIDKVMAKEAT